MNCVINPGTLSPHQFKYSSSDTANCFSESDGNDYYSVKNDEGGNLSDTICSNLPLMVGPTPASITTHFSSKYNLNSQPQPSTLASILNHNFLRSSNESYIQPIYDLPLQQVILPVECGQNQALMYLTRLCQGSKGPCILFKAYYWLTPNEFQYISGRETAKDWKRSIRHNGKSLKLLINKGILTVHSPLCECGTATSNFLKIRRHSSLKALGFDKQPGNYPTTDESDTADHGSMTEWDRCITRPRSATSLGDLDSSRTEGSSPRSLEWHCSRDLKKSTSSLSLYGCMDESDLIINEGRNSPKSESSGGSSSVLTTESQSEEPSLTSSAQGGNNNDGPPVKSKRKSKQSMALKTERQSPQLSSSTTSPPMTPPPTSTTNSTGPNHPSSGSSPPPQPIKQMEQMMSSNARNYSDFMRSLAAKYNQQQTNNITSDYYNRASPAANFAFDTRFLKPAAAAALLNLSCSQIPSSLFLEKDKFPMIDMSSTQTLLSMVRSASAAAANNLETLKTNSSSNTNSSNHPKRPNSPLDLSSRDLPSTPPPFKKAKLRNPLEVKATGTTPCLSSCSTGCTEEAQTMINWSVEDVCRFVSTIDLCKDYVEVFREHSIDGSSLSLLTEEHLMNAMNMKLGPALKFRSTVAKKLGTCVVCSHCTHCHSHNNNLPPNNSGLSP